MHYRWNILWGDDMGNLTAKTSGEIANFMTPAKTNIKSFKVHFSPKQLGTGDPSPENIREIEGWDGVEVAKSSVNLLDQSYITKASGWTLSSDNGNTMYCGVPVYKGKVNKFYTKFKSSYPFIGNPFKENVQYNVSAWLKTVNGNSIQGLKFGFKYTDGTTSLGGIFAANDTWKRQTVTSKANKTVSGIYCSYNNSGEIYLCGLAVCEKELDDTSVVYPSTANDISIDWSNNIETIYDGYIDLISGELVQDMAYGQVTSEWLSSRESGYIGYTSSITALDGSSGVWVRNAFNSTARERKSGGIKANCNTFKVLMNSTGVSSSQNRTAFAVDSSITNVSDFISAVETLEQNGNGLYLAYELATPIIHQLTPTQFKSFIGQNNFWSNADYVEIEYELKETEDIQKARKKIILNQPHIETVKDDLVNFTTNMKAPLKECRVYFNPIQEGSGDPSPENVKEIKGWDETNIYLSNEITLFNSFGATSGRASGINNNKRVTTNSYGTTINRTDTDGIKTELVVTQSIADSTKERYQNGYVSLFPNTDKLTVGNTYYFDADIEIISNPLDKLPEIMLTDDANNRWTITINDGKLHESFVWKERPTVYQYPFIEFYCNGCSFKLKNMVITPAREIKTVGWSDDVGTVYGGYVDLVKGELVANMTIVEFDGSSDENWQVETLSSGLTNYYMYATSLVPKARGNQRTDGYICSNMCIPRGENETYISGMFYFSNSGALNVYLGGKSNTSTVAEFKSWLTEHKLQIAYWLAEPIHYSLTPQQLLTLKGTNNIWSDTNGQTEVKFWTH